MITGAAVYGYKLLTTNYKPAMAITCANADFRLILLGFLGISNY